MHLSLWLLQRDPDAGKMAETVAEEDGEDELDDDEQFYELGLERGAAGMEVDDDFGVAEHELMREEEALPRRGPARYEEHAEPPAQGRLQERIRMLRQELIEVIRVLVRSIYS
jgi:hypothetical protein